MRFSDQATELPSVQRLLATATLHPANPLLRPLNTLCIVRDGTTRRRKTNQPEGGREDRDDGKEGKDRRSDRDERIC
jgi:hypothetical protein